jgi:hypothetical protein
MAMPNAALIRLICRKIHREADPEKIDELPRLLRAVIQSDPEEIRARMEFIRNKYAIAFDQAISCRCANPGES